MTLLAAFHALLARHSGQNDLAIGSPVAGRNRPELEGVIGCFVNSLVLRNRIGTESTFLEFLHEVRGVVLDALSHQELPFEKLVAELLPDRETNRNPLFQVMFSLRGEGGGGLHLAGIDVEPLGIPIEVAKVDLSLFISESARGLRCHLNYNTGLFAGDSALAMLGQFRELLADISASPDKPVSALRLMGDAERTRILHDWNDTAREFPRSQPLGALFSAQAARTPAAVAVRDDRAELSYAELERRSNQLAHYLIACGVEPDQPIGLAVSRSVDLAVGVLGIIKAGGAYLPVDADYPRERQQFMLEDARVQVLVTESGHATRLDSHGRRVVDLLRERRAIETQPDTMPAVRLTGDNLAYVVYTSGSTGKPKGVCIPHRAVSRLVVNTNYVQLDGRDWVAQLSNISFDAATFEIWGALLSGATLEIFARNVLLSPEAFRGQLVARRISALFVTTALFNRLVAWSPNVFAGVDTVMVGGETLDVAPVSKVLAADKPRRLLNGYGPTESTTFATWHEITPADVALRSIPIGRPISNTQAYVLDASLNPVPAGIAGELYLGGEGLARGYLDQPDLTAQKFIASPFAAGERLYRTGDLARWRADGTIEFIGRTDKQVKIRGHRIEPGEIEAQLNRHESIDSSLVLVAGNGSEDKRLVAYIVPAESRPVDVAEVRDFLKARVPGYMLPVAVVTVPAWPLTPNGKIDRAALPDQAAATARATVGLSPRNQTELHLCKIWEDLLGVEEVGVRDDFFALGGHSLLAVSMFDAVERLFGKRIPMDTLWYEGGTVETLARILRQDQGAISWPMLVPMQAQGDRTPVFLVHTLGGSLFHYHDLVRELGDGQPVYGLQARGVYGKEAPRTTVEAIAADCIEAMRSVQRSGPYRIVGFSSGGVVAYEMAQQLRRNGEPAGAVVLVDTFMPEVTGPTRLLGALRAMRHAESARDFQERVYHLVLRGLRLERLRKLVQIGEAQRWAHWSYVPRPCAGRVHLFVAEENEKAGNSPARRLRPLLGEHLLTHLIPGTHGSMVRYPHVTQLVTQLNAVIANGDSGNGTARDD
jgi:amino acid adenylation domain-containing protein